jgi:hypothetical protein
VWGPVAPERQGGEKIVRTCRDWQLGEELTEEWPMAAVLGRNPRGRVGCRWLEAMVRDVGSGGEARVLERRGRRGVETGGRVEQRERGVSDSATAGQRGKEEGKGGGPGVGVPRGAGVPWGLAPTSGRRPAAARARRSWAMCAT